MKLRVVAKMAAFSAAMLVSAAGFAGEKGADHFNSLDLDKDGKLTPMEASQNQELSNRWTEIDQDDSGTVDRVEFSAFEIETDEPKAPDAMEYQEQGSEVEKSTQ